MAKKQENKSFSKGSKGKNVGIEKSIPRQRDEQGMVPDVHDELLECKEQQGRRDLRTVYGAEDRAHKQHKSTDTGWNCPAQHTRASCCNKTRSLRLPKGVRSRADLSPTLTSQLFPPIPNLVPSSQPLPRPCPTTLLSEGQGSESTHPRQKKKTLANWDAPAVAWFCIVICKKNKNQKNTPTHTADSKHHSGQCQPLLQRPPPQKHCGALLTCAFQTRRPRLSSLLVPNIPRGTKSPLRL